MKRRCRTSRLARRSWLEACNHGTSARFAVPVRVSQSTRTTHLLAARALMTKLRKPRIDNNTVDRNVVGQDLSRQVPLCAANPASGRDNWTRPIPFHARENPRPGGDRLVGYCEFPRHQKISCANFVRGTHMGVDVVDVVDVDGPPLTRCVRRDARVSLCCGSVVMSTMATPCGGLRPGRRVAAGGR